MLAAEFLIEVDAYTGAGVETLRYSIGGYRSAPTDAPSNTLYKARILDPGTLQRALFGEGKTMGLGHITNGEIVLANNDGALDPLLTYGFDGRPLVIKRLRAITDALSTATVVFRGTVKGVDTGEAFSTIRLVTYDRTLELDEPVQTNRYGGTTTSGGLAGHLADGNADLKDQAKPIGFGRQYNVAPVCVNQFDLIYQVSDGACAVILPCDGQVPLATVGDFATVAALQAAAIPAGKFGTCLASGLFRLGVATYYQLTADVVEGATLADRCASAVVQRILAKMGITGAANLDTAGFAAFAAAAPQELGIFVSGDDSGASTIGQVLASVGGYLTITPAGLYTVGLAPVIGTSAWSININRLVGGSDTEPPPVTIVLNPDTDKNLPAYRTILRWLRSYIVQTNESLCPGAPAGRRSVATVALREAKVEDASVLTKYQLAPELVIDTLLVDGADAANEAARRKTLYGVSRVLLKVMVNHSDADAMTLGSTGTVTLDRFGLNAGKLFVVIERDDALDDETVTLTLWG